MSANPPTWLLDLGNTRLKLARLQADGEPGPLHAIEHKTPAAIDEMRRLLGSEVDGGHAWLASVAPAPLTVAVVDMLERAGLTVHRIRTHASLGRLRLAYPQPAQLGVDRFLGLLACCERDDGPWLLASVGSAVTLDLLASDGRHLGGAIAPSPAHMQAALGARFAQLDLPAGDGSRAFADNTADAIAAGAQGALLGLVERSLRLARERLGVEPTLVLGGGGASSLAGVAHPRVVQAPAIVLAGIARYARSGAG